MVTARGSKSVTRSIDLLRIFLHMCMIAMDRMSTLAPDYKKTVTDVVYHSAVVGLGAVAISYGLEKTKIAARSELKFDIKDGGKL